MSNDMTWSEWLQEVADDMNCEPEDILDGFRSSPRQLYEKGATPKEAADFLRQ